MLRPVCGSSRPAAGGWARASGQSEGAVHGRIEARWSVAGRADQAIATRDRVAPPDRRDAGEAVDTLVGALDTFHKLWGYVVLVAAVLAVVAAAAGWLGSLPPRETARRAGLLYIIPLDIQLLVGI